MPQRFSVEGTASQSGTSGAQNVPSGSALTLVASIGTKGIGKFTLNLFTVATALSDFQLWIAAAPPTSQPGASVSGTAVKRLSSAAGDFAVTDMVNNSTASPHTAGPLGSFVDMDLEGRAHRVDLYAASGAGDSVTIDACGVGQNVG